MAGLLTQTPDSATRAHYGAALATLRDSLATLEASAAAFESDLPSASADLVDSRAERLQRRCASAERASGRLLAILPRRAALRHELVPLRAALTRCTTEFTPGQPRQSADSVKAWGPYRLARLGDALRRYELAAREFARRAGIR